MYRHGFSTGRFINEQGGYVNIANYLEDKATSQTDQAGRHRTSYPVTLGDYKLTFNRLPQFFSTATNGDATVDYGEARRSHLMQTSSDGDYVIVQTFQSHNYFAGKSQFVEFTSFEFHDEPNVEKRYGYYSSAYQAPYQDFLDGVYLYTDGTQHYLRIVNKGDTVLNIPQSQWDDPLDGTGRSGYEINWKNFNVFQFSFLWLGGTGLRFSVVVGSKIYQAYEYAHVGSQQADKLIFSRPNKPIRMEIIQTGEGSGTFEPVCSTVMTEGSEATGNIGEVLAIDSGAGNNIKLSYPQRGIIKGLRLKPECLCTVVDIIGVDTFVSTTNDFYKWELVLNPSIVDSGGTPKTLPFTNVNGNAIQEATGDDNSFAVGGIVVESGYGSSRVSVSSPIESARKLGASVDGASDEIYLVITPLQGTTNVQVFGSINIKAFV